MSVSYAGAEQNTTFSVGFEIIEQQEQQDRLFSLITDQSQYIPGQMVSIVGIATEIIEFEGMKFTINDSSGNKLL